MAFTSVTIQPQLLTGVLARPEELPRVQEFRVASYNAWNLFGEAHDVYSSRPSDPASDEQLDALAKMILNLHADAIAFQEVQNEKVLASLFRERVNPKIKDAPYRFTTFVCIPARDPRGINVALTTRLAVRGSVTFHDREFGPSDDNAVRFSRDLLGVELFATPEYRFLMFVAHLKSKMGGDEATGKRRLEATEIRTILQDPQMGGNPYIDQDLVLCGDMNDDPDSDVVRHPDRRRRAGGDAAPGRARELQVLPDPQEVQEDSPRLHPRVAHDLDPGAGSAYRRAGGRGLRPLPSVGDGAGEVARTGSC